LTTPGDRFFARAIIKDTRNSIADGIQGVHARKPFIPSSLNTVSGISRVLLATSAMHPRDATVSSRATVIVIRSIADAMLNQFDSFIMPALA